MYVVAVWVTTTCLSLSKWYQRCSSVKSAHFLVFLLACCLHTIWLLDTGQCFFQDKIYEVDYCSQIFLLEIVNADKMFETKKYFYYGHLLIPQMWNHLPFPTQISYTPSQRHLYFGKTLTRYCDHHVCFNGICCPPPISYL